MGDILSAISDDIDEYVELCNHYDEKVEYAYGHPDCYGKHAKLLKERYEKERSKKHD